jgi:hypothetical protein
MAAQYIYLLKLREFINANQEVYKVGRTKQENQTRFKQYPKGSVLYFQMICKDCNDIEKKVLSLFKEKEFFNHRKDIGSEYFEGDYNEMISIIYSTIKQEKPDTEHATHEEECATYESNLDDENEYIESDEEEIRYEIKTYEEWIKYTKIAGIIITNKKKGEGYFRFKGQLWRELYDKNRFDFDEKNMEVLSEVIECNQPILWKIDSCSSELLDDKTRYEQKQQYKLLISVDYNVQEICKDIIKKCYIENCEYYELKPYEYVFSSKKPDEEKTGRSEYSIFNSQTFTFNDVDMLINNKILTCTHEGGRCVLVKNTCDVNIVDNILDTLIEHDNKHKYKTLLRNLIVKPNEKLIIFYDSDECLMTTFVTDLLFTILGSGAYVSSDEYYHNKKDFIKNIKITKPRCILIKYIKGTTLETQLNTFEKIGFKNIIVYDCYQQKRKPVYNIEKYKNYLQENKQVLMSLIKEENQYEPEHWESEISYNDSIFYNSRLLMTNFLRWSCIV